MPSTPDQTIGPFFHYALPYDGGPVLVRADRPGAITLQGTVFDGDGQPVPDALIEIWQLDERGAVVAEPGSLARDEDLFTGWGRAATDSAGRYGFTTVTPGPAVVGGAAFFAVCVFARGLLGRLFTRAYLPEDAGALSRDPLLSSLSDERRATLVAVREDDGGLRFDIRLQGDGETVFLQHTRSGA